MTELSEAYEFALDFCKKYEIKLTDEEMVALSRLLVEFRNSNKAVIFAPYSDSPSSGNAMLDR